MHNSEAWNFHLVSQGYDFLPGKVQSQILFTVQNHMHLWKYVPRNKNLQNQNIAIRQKVMPLAISSYSIP